MTRPRVVLDTSVIFSGLRSRRGASFALLSLLDSGRFEVAVSVPLVFEYEDVLSRMSEQQLRREDIHWFLDYLCRIAHVQDIFFLWRPCLPDPKDDLVLELAVAARCGGIVTHNRRHFVGSERFGLQVYSPKDFLGLVGGGHEHA